MARANLEAINIRCHDLKHQVNNLKAHAHGPIDTLLVDTLAAEIERYDASYHTGNEALDVVLTEKATACRAIGARLSAMADGSALAFMNPADLYSFFGNALENALEAVSQLPADSSRTIVVDVRRRGAMTAVHIDNPIAKPVVFKDGLPETTKEDADIHGFGVRSMMLVAKRCGGMVSFSSEAEVFSVDALFPVRQEEQLPADSVLTSLDSSAFTPA